ncbi:MAG: hypothetical protein ABR505_12290 [Actinomycetota bacterium]
MLLRTRSISLALAAVALLSLGVACGGGDDDTAEPAQQPETSPALEPGGEILIRAVDFSFLDIPTTLPAGEVTFRMVNEGKERHMFIWAKLTDDAPPIAELVELPERKVEKFLEKELPEIPPIKAGETSEKTASANLTPGRYGYVCFVFSKKEKAPHALLGMLGEFTVE